MVRKAISLLIIAAVVFTMFPSIALAEDETGGTQFSLCYDVNGGDGIAPETVIQNKSTTTAVSGGSGLSNGALVFWKWNTQPEGAGTDYYPGDEFSFTADTTLYAIYRQPVHVSGVSLSSKPQKMLAGNTYTLTATVIPEDTTYSEVSWTSSNEAAAVVDQQGRITAVSAGKTVITAAADGMFDTCTITVVANEFTVAFNTQGGPELPVISILEGGLVTEPAEPVRDGYKFEGWYKEQACINSWDFDTDTVTGNITLYAEWRKAGCAFSGSGTPENPYRITNAGELAALGTLVNAGDALYFDKCYIQTQDIDLSEYDNWAPIGIYISKPFSGVYDGNGYEISELKISVLQTELGAFGLFGYVTGLISNLSVVDSDINIRTNYNIFVGNIVGYMQGGIILKCNVLNGNINVTSDLTGNIGGIVGWVNNGSIDNCNFYGNLYGTGYQMRNGGIAGSATEGSDVNNCSNNGGVFSEGISYAYAGGIIGYTNSPSQYCSIEGCFNIGNIKVKGSTGSSSSGIVGFLVKTNVINCYNSGDIRTVLYNTGNGAGGIIGEGNYGSIQNCYNIGRISGYIYGGIIGRNRSSTNIITNCYYSDTCQTAVGTGIGTAYKKSLTELSEQSTFSDFDFDTVWTMDKTEETGYDYPQLKSNLLFTQEHEVSLNANFERGYTNGSGSYRFSDIVTIMALANEYYIFKNWVVLSGGAALTDAYSPSTTFMMPDSDTSIEAVYEKQKYVLTIQNGGNGTVTGSGQYAWGDIVPVSASSNNGFQFVRWELIDGQAEISDCYDMTATVTMLKSNATIRAVFGQQPTGFTYSVTDEKASITNYTGTSNAVIIPDRLGGYWVKAIESGAFTGKKTLTSVTIPDSVEKIGDYAFSECTSLTYVGMGKGVKDIGLMPFYNCESLKNIAIPDENFHYKSVNGVIYNKQGTELICCPPGIIGIYAIPEGIEAIREGAFGHCTYITDIDLPDTVVSIERYAFYYCTNLTSMHVPDSVTFIGESAFQDCKKLQSIRLSNMLSVISPNTFLHCGALNNVTLPDSVITIGNASFCDCFSLENVSLSENVQHIDREAFDSCDLKTVIIPRTIITIGENAFNNNPELTEAYFYGAQPQFERNVFAQSAQGFKLYFHVSKRTNWISYYEFPKYAFCIVTKDFQNGLPNETEIVLLDDFKIPQVSSPEWSDHTFKAWYKDEECTNVWNFDKDTTEDDITLYAKWQPGPYTISAVSTKPAFGTVSGGGVFNPGDTITLHAVPEEGCRFLRWTKGGNTVSSLPDYTFAAEGGGAYTAEFAVIDIPEITYIAFIGNASIQLEWTEVTGASGYQVWRAEYNDGPYMHIADIQSNSYTDHTLLMGTTYYYAVNAYYTTETTTSYGDQSDSIAQNTQLPAPVISFARSVGYDSINISWEKVQGATGYEIFCSTSNGGTYTFIYSTPQTSYTQKGLKTGSAYYYKIRAYDDTGFAGADSGFSNTVFSIPVPQRPEGLKATAYSATSVKLYWNGVSGRSGYEIWRSTSPVGGFSQINATSGTSYCDTAVKPNMPYYYEVRAYRNVGRKSIPGDFSDVVTGETVLSSVTDITVKMVDPTSIKISWDTVKGCKGYEVERSQYPDKEFSVIKSVSSPYYKDTGLVTNTRYYYRVCAYVMVGVERVRTGYSNVMSDMPVLEKVTGVKALVSSPTKVKISWSPVVGRSGYEILCSQNADGVYDVIDSTSSVNYCNVNLEPNKTYYYKIRAYRIIGGIKKYGEESEAANANPVFGSAAGTGAIAYTSTKNKITWSAVTGRSGYEIYRSETAESGFTYIASAANTYCYDTNQIFGKTYYYCVRAYVMIGNIRFYTDYSNVACVVRTQ